MDPLAVPTRDRTRSLGEIEELLAAAGGVEAAIRVLVALGEPIDVLEVGFGHGRALLDLAWRLRDHPVNFHGVDIGYKSLVRCREDLRDVAQEWNIIPAPELDAFELPHIAFSDATTLELPGESMDLVFSAVTIRFMRDKARHIEEVCRVLRPGGRAILHVGEANWDYPSGPVAAEPLLTPHTSRLVLRHGDQLVPLGVYLKLFEDDVFRFTLTPQTRCLVIVDKLRSGTLELGLVLDEDLTMNGRKVPLRNHHGDVRGGVRSVYDVGADAYARLAATLSGPAQVAG